MGTASRGRVVVRRFSVYQATRSVGFISPIFTLVLAVAVAAVGQPTVSEDATPA